MAERLATYKRCDQRKSPFCTYRCHHCFTTTNIVHSNRNRHVRWASYLVDTAATGETEHVRRQEDDVYQEAERTVGNTEGWFAFTKFGTDHCVNQSGFDGDELWFSMM